MFICCLDLQSRRTSNFAQNRMKNLKDQVYELQKNEKHMLEAIKHLSERLKDIEQKEQEVKDVLESQSVIDEVIVKNSDDIVILKKTKDKNAIAIKALETKLYTLDQEVERRALNMKLKLESVKLHRGDLENISKAKENETKGIICKHYDKGFCKMKERCLYRHKSKEVCEETVIGNKCLDPECLKRHPKTCWNFMKGACWRGKTCAYLHYYIPNSGNDAEQESRENIMEVDCSDDNTNEDETQSECGNCKSNDTKNECDKCGKTFCTKCEYKVNGEESESVMDFFKSRNFINYTCTTAHF